MKLGAVDCNGENFAYFLCGCFSVIPTFRKFIFEKSSKAVDIGLLIVICMAEQIAFLGYIYFHSYIHY